MVYSLLTATYSSLLPDLKGDVVLHLVDEVDHLSCQDMTLVQHT